MVCDLAIKPLPIMATPSSGTFDETSSMVNVGSKVCGGMSGGTFGQALQPFGPRLSGTGRLVSDTIHSAGIRINPLTDRAGGTRAGPVGAPNALRTPTVTEERTRPGWLTPR